MFKGFFEYVYELESAILRLKHNTSNDIETIFINKFYQELFEECSDLKNNKYLIDIYFSYNDRIVKNVVDHILDSYVRQQNFEINTNNANINNRNLILHKVKSSLCREITENLITMRDRALHTDQKLSEIDELDFGSLSTPFYNISRMLLSLYGFVMSVGCAESVYCATSNIYQDCFGELTNSIKAHPDSYNKKAMDYFTNFVTKIDYFESILRLLETNKISYKISINKKVIQELVKSFYGNALTRYLFSCSGEVTNKYEKIFRLQNRNSEDDNEKTHFSSGTYNMLSIILNILFNSDVFDEKEKTLVIVDEPEVSLHYEYQLILNKFFKKVTNDYNMRIILTTHSPFFISDYETKLKIKD